MSFRKHPLKPMNSDTYGQHVELLTSGGFEIYPPRFDRLNGLIRIDFQIRMAKQSLEELISGIHLANPFEEFYARYLRLNNFVSQYGKCFGSHGDGLVVHSKGDVFSDSSVFLEGHERILELRHNLAAHNGLIDLIQSGFSTKELDDKILVKNAISFALDFSEYSHWQSVLNHLSNYNETAKVKEQMAIQAENTKPVFYLPPGYDSSLLE